MTPGGTERGTAESQSRRRAGQREVQPRASHDAGRDSARYSREPVTTPGGTVRGTAASQSRRRAGQREVQPRAGTSRGTAESQSQRQLERGQMVSILKYRGITRYRYRTFNVLKYRLTTEWFIFNIIPGYRG